MPRANSKVASHKRRKKVLKMAKGSRGARSNVYTVAKHHVQHNPKQDSVKTHNQGTHQQIPSKDLESRNIPQINVQSSAKNGLPIVSEEDKTELATNEQKKHVDDKGGDQPQTVGSNQKKKVDQPKASSTDEKNVDDRQNSDCADSRHAQLTSHSPDNKHESQAGEDTAVADVNN